MTGRKDNIFRYTGLSMWPCFQEGDLLEIESVATAQIRMGDCVVFFDHGSQRVVHRVYCKGHNLKTRGDAFKHADEHAVPPHRVIGRVVCRYRMGRRVSITNGIIGHVAGRLYHFAGRIDPQRRSRGGRLARAIQKLSLTGLKPLWQRGRIHTLQRNGEPPVVVWRLGTFTVGSQDAASKEWTVLWPWKIMVKLPLEAE